MFFNSTQQKYTTQPVISALILASATLGPITMAGESEPSETLTAISGRVWLDKNENGIQDGDDAGERGFFEAPVDLLDKQGQVIKSVKTLASGYYEFADVAPGEYQVQFYYPPECRFTEQNVNGNDGTDSDANADSGIASGIVIDDQNPLQLEVDAGVSCGPVSQRTEAENDSVTGYVGETLTVDVLDNDTLPSSVSELKIIANPSGIPAQFNDEHQLVIEGITEPGEYTLEYRVDCDTDDGATATVLITIHPVNPPMVDQPKPKKAKKWHAKKTRFFKPYFNKGFSKYRQYTGYGVRKFSRSVGNRSVGRVNVLKSRLPSFRNRVRVRRAFTSRNWRC